MTSEDRDAVWSQMAVEWERSWGSFADPVRQQIIRSAGIVDRVHVLDVGCGSGEFLRMITSAGGAAAGVDPSETMRTLAQTRCPEVDIRPGDGGHLPWPDDSFDVVTAINSLELADDLDAALAEITRVLRPGGLFAVANWADGAQNDVDVVEAAVAAFDGEPAHRDGPLRESGGQAAMLADAGFAVTEAGLVRAPWGAASVDDLVRGLLIGEDAQVQSELTATVVAASAPFRTKGGAYVLQNAFRFAVGQAPAAPS